MDNYLLVIWGLAIALMAMGEYFKSGYYFAPAIIFTLMGALFIGEPMIYLAAGLLVLYQGSRIFALKSKDEEDY